jgi:signal transduction histidine kinase
MRGVDTSDQDAHCPEHMRAHTTFLAPALAAVTGGALVSHVVVARRARVSDLNRERRRMVEAIDSERLRIQRDLHDAAQQRIISIRLRLTMVAQASRMDRSAVLDLAQELDAALSEIRGVTVADSPDHLSREGLPAALRRAAATAPLPVEIDSGEVGRLDPQVERQLYFSCLEGLQNVFKHSGAHHAWVRLSQKDGRVAFEVLDDGRGFDLSKVTIGQGLRNISFRLSSLGGWLSIGANPGRGTRLRGDVPIAESFDRQRLLGSIRLPARRWPSHSSPPSPRRVGRRSTRAAGAAVAATTRASRP